jgi:diacylglycerol kinase family enzyme
MESAGAPRTPETTRPVLIVNPESTRAGHVQKQVRGPLEDSQWGSRLHIIETRDPAKWNNPQLILEQLQPNDLVIVGGGDGLANIVGRAVLQQELGDDEQRASMLILPFGNGNDLARATAGMNVLRHNRLLATMAHGEAEDFGIITGTDSDDVEHIALGYLGIGATAEAAVQFNDHDYRVDKQESILPGKLIDFWKMLQLARASQQFKYHQENDQNELAHELVWNNIPTMAKYLHIAGTKGEHTIMSVMHRQRLVVDLMLRSARGHVRGIRGQPVTESQVELVHDTPVQGDGEPTVAPSGLFVVRYQPKALTVVTQPSRNLRREAA